ncbi:MAG: GAF domain-containing sensor histidine kinase [Leptolyngbyaceae cyanobacterium SL_1_1]|nr:GAF domain-containing sensor histidine kinase [Leptolyngbyaceae cyanobacterium RM1_1_2]NJO09257.1 GAF domain-containing sensor histidine kinase [Leptolyngbyaceae cyanobacterium SL_1_1]
MTCHMEHPPLGLDQDLEKQRLRAVQELELLSDESIPVFDEATQTAARILAAPICVFSISDRSFQFFKSAAGLSQLGLMNELAASRRLPRQEALCSQVVDSAKILIVEDTAHHPEFAQSRLIKHYGIRAYLGVPLVVSSGECIGSLAVMDLVPRQFTAQDIAFLELNARWSISEFERDRLFQSVSQASSLNSRPKAETSLQSTINAVRIELIGQLTQELRNPLTSIMGMASMLSRKIYGPLTEKQKEYADIIRDSSQTVLNLMDEIIGLGTFQEDYRQLNLAPADVEMLAQQAVSSLDPLAQQQAQSISLTTEPGSRIWILDKSKIKQLIYHLIYSVIQLSSEGGTVRIHISRKGDRLNLAVWFSHPWLGEGLSQSVLSLDQLLAISSDSSLESGRSLLVHSSYDLSLEANAQMLTADTETAKSDISREGLGLLLSRQLTEMHGGTLALQGSIESGYRYVVSLPQLAEEVSTVSVVPKL